MIRRLLVANRGDAARRVFASCRLIGIETVAVYSDLDADQPYVAEADWAVHLPGTAPTATYRRPDLLLAAARRTGADAVHPGWGPLADDPEFAAAVCDAGLAWVGPPAKTLSALRDKAGAAARLADAGVSVLPQWNEPERVDEFPVMVKPVGGSDGRGIRLVHDAAQLAEAVSGVRSNSVYFERFVPHARHLDLQIMADSHGNTVTFGERECSVQRGYQQLVTESPSPAVPQELREELVAMAVRAAEAFEFVGAGTVEVLLAPDGSCYVLSVSPRLPADHSVTECSVGLDLIRMQLLIAEGSPLPFTGAPPIRGHTIGVRLRAEDPACAWAPTTGTLHRFAVEPVTSEFRPLPVPGLRSDPSIADGGTVTAHYDTALASLVAWAPTRHEAGRLLAATLARARIHGVVTNRDLLVRVLRHPVFQSGDADTGFLDDHPEVYAPLLSSVDSVRLSCLAGALAAAADRRSQARVLAGLPSGWRNVPVGAQTMVFDGPSGLVEIGYRLDRVGELAHWWVRGVDPEELDLAGLGQPSSLPDDHPPVAVVEATGDRVVLDVSGVRLTFSVHRVDSISYVDSTEGSVVLYQVPRYRVPTPAEEDPDASTAPITRASWAYSSAGRGFAAIEGLPAGGSATAR